MNRTLIRKIKPAILDHLGRDGVLFKMILRLLSIMFLFTVCRVAFYLYNNSLFPQMTFWKFSYILWGGLKFDISAILYTNALYILIFTIPHPLRYKLWLKKVGRYLFFTTNGFILWLNCYDMMFYPFSLRRTTLQILKEFENEGNIMGIFLNAMVDYWPIVILFFVMIFLMVKLYGKDIRVRIKSNWIAHYSIGLVLMLASLTLVVGGMRGGFLHSNRPITLSNAGKYVEFPREMNIVLNTPFAIYRTLGKVSYEQKNYFESRDELDQVFTPIHSAPETSEAFKYDNVVIFILESFGREFLGTFNKHLDNGTYEGYTPFLDSLLTKSKTYWFSFSNGKKSIDAMPSIFASIPSIKTPYVLTSYSGNKINGLASILKSKGYSSSFFHGAPNGSMGFESFAKLAGFEKYYGKTEYNNNGDYDGIWGIWDDKFFDFYADGLNKMQEPFLGALFSISSHHPFKVPEEFEGKLKHGPTPLHRCVNYSDKALQKFFNKVATMPWFENTLFVITADHTQANPYHEEYRTTAGLYRVPIIFYHPQHPEWAEQDSEELVQHLDIMPSILGYLNYEEAYFAFGRNIFDTLSAPYVINYRNNAYQFIADDYLLQYDDEQDKTLGFYNFRNDTMLRQNIVGQLPVIQQQMERRIRAFIQQYNYSIVNNKMSVPAGQ